MNIPKEQNLYSQNFNSESIEFVWMFLYEDKINRIIFKVFEDGDTILNEQLVSNDADYGEEHDTMNVILETKNISKQELTRLKEEALTWLDDNA
jgi:hypothetical protein